MTNVIPEGMKELHCIACGCSIIVAKGQIQYYCKDHRKLGRRVYAASINSELHRKRPWYFWLWLWIKRRLHII